MELPKTNGKKVLPFKYPRITSYPFHANIISIFEAYDAKEKEEKMLPWIYNYYIQIQAGKTISNTAPGTDFCVGVPTGHIKNCPWIVYHGLDRNLVNHKWGSFSDFAVDSIDFDYYMYLYLDYFYVPVSGVYHRDMLEDGRAVYGGTHFYHDMMIYGYNDIFL